MIYMDSFPGVKECDDLMFDIMCVVRIQNI